MNKTLDLLKDDVKELYFKYLFPSICATLVTSIYILADTIIIGKGIGPQAVAALNLILPLFNVLYGTGLLFGVGGCILLSIHRANHDYTTANAYFSTAFVATAVMSIIYLFCGIFFFDRIISVLGVSKETLHYVNDYGKYLIIGIPFSLFSAFFQAFVRNDKSPKLCMIAVISGGVLNIILDLLFVYGFHLEMKGAAIATVLGTITTCSILSLHFLMKSNTLKFLPKQISLSFLKNIVKNGISSFLLEMAGGIATFFFNLQLLKYIGVLGVTVYSIIANTAIIVISLGNGISQSAQPILSTNYGAQQYKRIEQVRTLGMIVAGITGTIFMCLGLFFPEMIIRIFVHPTKDIMKLAPTAIRIYFISFVGCTLNMFLNNYFQSIVKPMQSLTICLLRGMILNVLLVYLLPAILGYIGIWFVMPLTEAITFLVAFIFLKKMKH